jgi:hypothetical protein
MDKCYIPLCTYHMPETRGLLGGGWSNKKVLQKGFIREKEIDPGTQETI